MSTGSPGSGQGTGEHTRLFELMNVLSKTPYKDSIYFSRKDSSLDPCLEFDWKPNKIGTGRDTMNDNMLHMFLLHGWKLQGSHFQDKPCDLHEFQKEIKEGGPVLHCTVRVDKFTGKQVSGINIDNFKNFRSQKATRT